MKTVITYNPNNDIVAGIAASLKYRDPQTVLWDVFHKPISDMFDELHPDILFLDSLVITSDILKVAKNYPDLKIVMFGSSYYRYIEPSVICLSEFIQQKTIDELDKANINHITIKRVANTAQYSNGKYNKDYESDILYLSTTKNGTNYSIIEKLSYTDYTIKICGNYAVYFSCYLGPASFREMSDLMKSTKLAIDFNGVMLYNYIANGVFCLSDTPNPFMPSFSSFEELQKLIYEYLPASNKKQSIIDKAQSTVVKQYTYFNYLDLIFDKIS